MTYKRRVVITGVGAVSPIGNTAPDTWAAAKSGTNGVDSITIFDASNFPVRFAAEVKNFDPEKYIDPKEVKRLDRSGHFGYSSAAEAIKDSGIDAAKEDPFRIGVVIGAGVGGIIEWETQHNRIREKGPSRVSPFFIPKLMGNASAGFVGINFGFMGPNYGAVSACASASHSICDAFHIIVRDDADVVVAGGTEAAVSETGVAGFAAMNALSTWNDRPKEASRPFDAERSGFVIGEGGGAIIMEELEHAKKRGAQIYAEVIGVGMSCDAHHITAPDPEGKGGAFAVEQALRGYNKEDVSYVCAHGTSTKYNDEVETAVLHKVFGEHAKKLAVSSVKSMIGHALGGSGALATAITAYAVKEGVCPPTINYRTPDPQCDLFYVPNEAIEKDVNIAIIDAFGFGGHNAIIALKKFNG